jgi:hypothetical protein
MRRYMQEATGGLRCKRLLSRLLDLKARRQAIASLPPPVKVVGAAGFQVWMPEMRASDRL